MKRYQNCSIIVLIISCVSTTGVLQFFVRLTDSPFFSERCLRTSQAARPRSKRTARGFFKHTAHLDNNCFQSKPLVLPKPELACPPVAKRPPRPALLAQNLALDLRICRNNPVDRRRSPKRSYFDYACRTAPKTNDTLRAAGTRESERPTPPQSSPNTKGTAPPVLLTQDTRSGSRPSLLKQNQPPDLPASRPPLCHRSEDSFY